ncbi:Tryptophan--tRNA ligase, mitochondrial [Hondaea fermentalgiana]|uniref:tryptophan--tRNA ligase n=1 Tax=Hondaea fermentalgiana TaxID=2315210 RepID=A0A2R5GL40_9STRA|nr:Tryptophan--tRNA ligase, mitochondrial [Hondaea fermentalgiana]|eukprot:GBG28594.1 Tryptophan--tRNA ligase, mitochondrial [Hondaea fermentalgiana]
MASTAVVRQVLSGITPSGVPTLGNYLGALRSWIWLQRAVSNSARENGVLSLDASPLSEEDARRALESYDQDIAEVAANQGDLSFAARAQKTDGHSLFMIADLHAMTVPKNMENLRQKSFELVASYLACGLDPKQAVLFQQSRVAAHSEFAWIMQCYTSVGRLNRMTQFKEKAGKRSENATAGLYTYPSLMAADILLYNPTHVPVGDDQMQHLEFTRDMADRFNDRANLELFRPPDAIYQESGAARIMSLRDGNKKMSKSDPNEGSRILLTDSADDIARKIKKAVTDTAGAISRADRKNDRPAVFNLLTISAALRGTDLRDELIAYDGRMCSELKNDLTELLVDVICPIGDEVHRLLDDRDVIYKVLDDGADRAAEIASITMKDVHQVMGLTPFSKANP